MEITLEGKAVSLAEPTFGKIKKVVSAYNRLNLAISRAATPVDDDVVAGMTDLLCLALDKPVETVDAMTISFAEMMAATPKIAELCGITFRRNEGGEPGERQGADGMNSTSTS